MTRGLIARVYGITFPILFGKFFISKLEFSYLIVKYFVVVTLSVDLFTVSRQFILHRESFKKNSKLISSKSKTKTEIT